MFLLASGAFDGVLIFLAFEVFSDMVSSRQYCEALDLFLNSFEIPHNWLRTVFWSTFVRVSLISENGPHVIYAIYGENKRYSF